MKLRNIIFSLGTLLFPMRCPGCNTVMPGSDPSTRLCETCQNSIALLSGVYCSVCGRRLSETVRHPHSNHILFPATDFKTTAIRNCIHALKYRRERLVARICAELLFLYLKKIERSYDLSFGKWLLIPIPLHPRRARERGFNQSELIAKELLSCYSKAKQPAPSFSASLLARTAYAPAQVRSKTRKARQKNLEGMFAVRDAMELKNQDILLLDDVSTTGTTLHEASAALLRAGARRVFALVVAKVF
ncbi:MAG: ComF family protein [Patescibacteria group bacterium]